MTTGKAAAMEAGGAAPRPVDATLVATVLGTGHPPARARRRWWSRAIILGLVVATLLAGIVLDRGRGARSVDMMFSTEAAHRGTLVVKVAATGSIEPTNTVEVGSELSGIVDDVFIDENDHVHKGQILAQLDLARLTDAVARSRANLGVARAQVLQAEATTTETQTILQRLEELHRVSGGKVPSAAELTTAAANVARARATLAGAHAAVVQARAALQSDETNVMRASVRSPIDGIVLRRSVEPGQTVAASFQAPVLFTIAEDLTKMELRVDVDEADVAQVRAGQSATFTVDAWPQRRFSARIMRLGYGAQDNEGVVSYRATLEVANEDLSLRPGMTGSAEIVTMTHDDVLLVPAAALRFEPPGSSSDSAPAAGGVMSRLMPRMPRTSVRPRRVVEGAPHVWVLRGQQPTRVDVVTGPTDGQLTEIVGGPLEEGALVITEAIAGPGQGR